MVLYLMVLHYTIQISSSAAATPQLLPVHVPIYASHPKLMCDTFAHSNLLSDMIYSATV